MLAEASDMIPTCIAGIHEFWRNYQKAPPRQGRSKREVAGAGERQLVATASMVDQVGKAIAKANGACFESSGSLSKVAIGGAEAARPTD